MISKTEKNILRRHVMLLTNEVIQCNALVTINNIIIIETVIVVH